jgi:DNA-binding CsgD family transcriptional regulator
MSATTIVSPTDGRQASPASRVLSAENCRLPLRNDNLVVLVNNGETLDNEVKVLSAPLPDSSHTFDAPSLADLLEPTQFKAMLLVTCGLENYQIAQCLRTTEQTIRNVLWSCYQRTGCRNSDELVRRYFCEVAIGLLEHGRLQQELAALADRAAQILDGLPESPSQYIN